MGEHAGLTLYLSWSADGHGGRLWSPDGGAGSWFIEHGFLCTVSGTLRKYPGSMHYHFKAGRTAGTLELTVVATQCQVWAEVRSNRSGDAVINSLAKLLEEFGPEQISG